MHDLNQWTPLELLTLLVGFVTLLVVTFVAWTIARDMLERPAIKFWPYRFKTKGGFVRKRVSGFIYDAERQFSVVLSPAAHEMLMLPVEESFELEEDVDFEEVKDSIYQLIQAMASDESAYPSRTGPSDRKTAKSVIRAFYMRFCKIPPFCDGRGR